MQRLFAIEHRIREAEPEERWRVRQTESAPVVEAFRAWLDETLPKVVPGSAIGKALTYTVSQWPKLIRFLDDRRTELHNNRAENAIRPFVIGRNNWKFSVTVAGAKASANLYSLIETAKANGLEPYGYLRRLFQELPKAESIEAIEALLPWHFQSVTDAFPESKSAVA
jgi:transposase